MRPVRGTLAATIVLLLAGIGVLVVRVVGDGGQAGPPAEDVAYLLPGELPPAFTLADLSDGTETSGDTEVVETHAWLYGSGPDEAPLQEGDLVLTVIADPGGDDGALLAGEGVVDLDIRSTTGQFVAVDEPIPTASLAWVEGDGMRVQVASHTLGREALLEFAQSLSFGEALPDVDGGDLPDGYRLLREGRWLTPPIGAPAGGEVTYSASYAALEAGEEGGDGDRGRILTVAGGAGQPRDLLGFFWLGGDRARELSVRGLPGVLVESSRGGGTGEFVILAWVERDTLVVLTTNALPADELIELATGMRWISATEWAALRPELPPLREGQSLVVAGESGRGHWRMYAEDGGGVPGGSVCFDVAFPSLSTRCRLSAASFPHGRHVSVASWVGDVVYGAAGATVSRVVVITATGESIEAELHEVAEGSGIRWWVAVVEGDADPEEVAAFDGDGSEIDRSPIPTAVREES